MRSLFRDYETISRSGLFDAAHYAATYPDVARRNIDPLVHYLEEGARAARNPHPDFDAEFYLEQCKLHGQAPENPLLHYLTVGLALGLKTKANDAVSPPVGTEPLGPALSSAEPAIATPVFSHPPMQLYLDEATVDVSGILRLSGWVVCLAPLASVDVLLDNTPLGSAESGRLRVDVGEMRPEYPNSRFSGFLLLSDVRGFGAGSKTIVVRASTETGIVRELTKTVEIPDIVPDGSTDETALRYHCDHVSLTTTGRVVIRGWLVCPAPATAIGVAVDGRKVGEAQLGLERPDVGNLFPSLPHARTAGFAAECHCGSSISGEHLISLRVLSQDNNADEVSFAVFAREADDEPGASVPPTNTVDTLRLNLDVPELIDGVLDRPVRGNLELSGWALARAGVETVEIAVDATPLTAADYGLRRTDVRAAFPDWQNSLESGFFALVPHRMLPRGPHKITVTLRDRVGGTASINFPLVVEPLPDNAGPWALRQTMPAAEVALGRRLLAQQPTQPNFEVLLAIDSDTQLGDASRTIASLHTQVFSDWRLTLFWNAETNTADPEHARLVALLKSLGSKYRRKRIYTRADLPQGDTFVMCTQPGTQFGCDALHQMAIAIATYPKSDFFYSDERRFNPSTGNVEAFFKPQWSPDLLLATNYVGHLWCARSDLVRSVLAAKENLLLSHDYDLVLRCTERAQEIRHLPSVLCEHTVARDAGRETKDRHALERTLQRLGTDGQILPGLIPGTYRFKRKLAVTGMVSIIIPTRAAEGMIRTCVETIRGLTTYQNLEIICIENIPSEQADWRDWLRDNVDRVVSADEPFNWSRFNNIAAAAAHGEFLLFLNDDVEIIDPDWLTVMLEHAQRPEVGVVGPLLLYPDERIQHAGMFLAAMAQARHAFRYASAADPGYFGLALTERNVIAVTGACFLTRRETFDRLGGFDEAHNIVNNDIDYCLRVWERGLRTVFTPHARLIHYEAVSRTGMNDDFDAAAFDSKWRDVFLRGDPFFSPHLSKAQDAIAPDDEPNRVLVTGGPFLVRSEIKKILAVKLDHIGDCIIALPAVRRLKRHFPEAGITVLTSRASRSVWALEPSIDTVIEFDFFYPRSSLGQIQLTDEDWRDLRDRLAPEGFDLAVDLRKHLETRPVLQHTGARYLAGVDYRDRFPWLDVSIEWTGDQAYVHKRQHNADDLINLVDAIAAACEADRQLIAAGTTASAASLRLREAAKGGPLVCLHPTAGNETKQWPIEYFAFVADRLVEDDGARIVLIGSADEETIGDQLIGRMRRSDQAVSLIGQLELTELPSFLLGCSLFLGNDSGPKHIAAGLGIPTVAVHSGTVDVYEWGPVGSFAVAVARDVACTPCYLPRVEDCRRGLACLRQLAPETVYAACKRLLLVADRGSSINSDC